MAKQTRGFAAAIVLVTGLAAVPAGAVSTLDGWPSRTVYLSNDAPFVVFGVTPTRLDRQAGQLRLSFIATDELSQVNIFPFVRATPGTRAVLRSPVACGPREAGSWDCVVPLEHLLAELEGSQVELGLRIEAHGDLQRLGEHSTVVVTVPVGRAAPKSRPPAPRSVAPMP